MKKLKLFLFIQIVSVVSFLLINSISIYDSGGYEEKINSFNKNLELANDQIKKEEMEAANKTLDNAESDLKFIKENIKKDIKNNVSLCAYLASKNFYPENKIYESNSEDVIDEFNKIIKEKDENISKLRKLAKVEEQENIITD